MTKANSDIYSDRRDVSRSIYRRHPGLPMPAAARERLQRKRLSALWSGMIKGAIGLIVVGVVAFLMG